VVLKGSKSLALDPVTVSSHASMMIITHEEDSIVPNQRKSS